MNTHKHSFSGHSGSVWRFILLLAMKVYTGWGCLDNVFILSESQYIRNLVSLNLELSKKRRHFSDPSGTCGEFSSGSHTLGKKTEMNYLDSKLINIYSKTFSNKQMVEFILQLLLKWLSDCSGNILKSVSCWVLQDVGTCQMQKKELLWCQKAQKNSKVMERAIKVDQFKLAGFTDKWFLPL